MVWTNCISDVCIGNSLMSDFILPGDIEAMAQEVSDNISYAWNRLTQLCYAKSYAVSLAEVSVHAYVYQGMTELEAIREVYREIVSI